MNSDISVLIRRSQERRAELSQRAVSREEARWGARIALAGVPENDLVLPRWRHLLARFRRSSRTREACSEAH